MIKTLQMLDTIIEINDRDAKGQVTFFLNEKLRPNARADGIGAEYLIIYRGN